MKKYLFAILAGFLLAQGSEYGASMVVNRMQVKCYHFWPEQKVNEYQKCMDDQKGLIFLSDALGFNFVYEGRKVIYGY